MALEIRLPKNGFNSIIRMLNKGTTERASQIRHATYTTLKRVGTKRDKSKAISGIPNGSDQTDVGSIVTWLNKVTVANVEAIEQVVAIDATAFKRTKG